MSVKHVKKYYNQLYEEYKQVIGILAEIDAESQQKLISPDEVQRIKGNYEPVINSFRELAFFVYLLNKPNRESKQEGYKKQNKKILLDNEYIDEKVIARNESIIKSYKKED